MDEKIITICREIDWNPIYEKTIPRIKYFYLGFRASIKAEDVSDDELLKNIIYSLGAFGQEHLYNIYCAENEQNFRTSNPENLTENFNKFIEVINEALEIKLPSNRLPSKSYINLYIEYIFAKFIKR